MKIITHSENETIEFGHKLADSLKPGDVVALIGELGSGKTCLTRGICQGFDVKEDVTSPTFVLINEYRGRIPIYHFDFYRLDSSEEVLNLGVDDYFNEKDGLCLIEWADRALSVLPAKRIEIKLTSLFEQNKEFDREIEVSHLNP
ncbi:tRNA (adenosine(37)-N6)-threonylcarbamoyltransferase complex ATPase subunit type 1 TsaE [candidate division KSB1 bacterium]|nr:tRNA (adenosine(37)-N6)-threonylcarbamoyltransferase complex ATPase subunit type 1 TsaE [candidate division KSB1 bacterium]